MRVMTEISIVAVLDDPVRRRLYEYVALQPHGVSRNEAAQAVGIQRTLAAFHLDRLAEAGLVSVTFRRPDGRTGPGAGRPAKLYQRTATEHQVSVPPRDYRSAAELLAEVVPPLTISRVTSNLPPPGAFGASSSMSETALLAFT